MDMMSFVSPIALHPAFTSTHNSLSALHSLSSNPLATVTKRDATLRRPPAMSVAESLWQVNRVESKSSAAGKKVAIVGAGLGGLITAMELVDAGVQVDIYDTRPFVGGKVGSWVDNDGNHIEMGLHVFFGCYYNLFDIMAKVGSFKHLLLKDHIHQFINTGGIVGALDFRFGQLGAPFNGLKAFASTTQLGLTDKVANAYALGRSVIVRGLVDLDGAMTDIRALDNISFSEWFLSKGGTRGSIQRMWDPIAYALGFIDCDNMSARCMLTIFQLFAARSEASVLRMLEGSPDRFLTGPIVKYIEDRGGRIHLRRRVRQIEWRETGSDNEGRPLVEVTGLEVAKGAEVDAVRADYYVAACDVMGMQRLIPAEWREKFSEFDKIFDLSAVPVVTVQIRFDGWVTELNDAGLQSKVGDGKGYGLDNLLYSADTDFSCFADLAVTSPTDYYKEGEGSLMQCVLTPGDPYIRKKDEDIVQAVTEQIYKLFPSSRSLKATWSSVVKLAESLYREEPGKDSYRPKQATSIPNMFLAGSYTYQDYIDSMEGAVKSGRLAAAAVLTAADQEIELEQQ